MDEPRCFDHEKLDVYRLAVEFLGWAGELLDGPLVGTRYAAVKHLDEASQSIANNIAEGNGKRSPVDRCRYLDIARGSALECAACLDGLVAIPSTTPRGSRDGRPCPAVEVDGETPAPERPTAHRSGPWTA